MSGQVAEQSRYKVSVTASADVPDVVWFTFVPKGTRPARPEGGPPKPMPQYVLCARGVDDEAVLAWDSPPRRSDAKEKLEQLARERLAERSEWIRRATEVVETIEQWAKELGWSTRRITKKLDDSRLGTHRVPAVVMQENTVRVLLEPVAPLTLGSSALIDLCLMPGYDDIAHIDYQGETWRVQYVFPDAKPAGSAKLERSQPLAKRTIGAILETMKRHGE